MIIYCATSNPGKLREFQLAAPDFEQFRQFAESPIDDRLIGIESRAGRRFRGHAGSHTA